jgi:RHS repeat-associated protein
MRTAAPGASRGYPYGGTAYANPDAVTQIANGLSTTTFTYDNNGNVTQKTVDGTTTTYVYDYANRLTALGVLGATTTYGYDAFGQRVLQTGTTTTYLYPFKWFSVASSTGTGAKFATTTEYLFNGDSLVSTTDQQTASGVATGSPATYYIHPDHLGSTNVVTNQSGVVQTLDYYPYGATRTNTGSTATKRQYIGQFSDVSGLSYLQARYYDSGRGQFISEDPVFWGEPKQQNLNDPQSFNTYSYSVDNPIIKKDPSGLQCVLCAGAEVLYSLGAQTSFDAAFGQSSPAVYGGDVVSASLYGLAYPWTLVAPVPFAAASGGAGNVAQQGIEYIGGDRTAFDPSQVQSSAVISGGTQLAVGWLPIPFISGSSLERQIATKLERGSISRVSGSTLTKIAISNAPGSFVGNFATNYAQTRFSSAFNSSSSYQSAAMALSSNLPGSSLSTTINIARVAIQLAQAVLSSYKSSSSH